MRSSSYNAYKPDMSWRAMELVKTAVCISVICVLFFRSAAWFPAVIPVGIMLWKTDVARYADGRKRRLREEFKDMIIMLSGNLNVGYSLENSFIRTAEDMRKLYGDKGMLQPEMQSIINGLRCNCDIEILLKAFGDRSGIAEIADCADLIAAAKRHGGDTIQIIRQVARNLSERSSVEAEIEATIAAKQLEGRIMMIMPFAVVWYMRVTNGSYMEILYQTLAGNLVMGLGLALILLAGWIINRITQIEV